jgi:phosphohistidine swiveling domain-containing protein
VNWDSSPVHEPGRTCRYTTANAEEVLGGVLTPMTWSVYRSNVEAATRAAWHSIGVLAASEVPAPEDPDGRFYGCMYGRCCLNVDVFGAAADRMPGASGAALEEQLFGGTWDTPEIDPRARRRYPVVAVRAPGGVIKAFRRMQSDADSLHSWWHRTVTDLPRLGDPAVAAAVNAEAADWYARTMHDHIVITMVGQGIFDQVATLAANAGQEGLDRELITSAAGTDELRVAGDLWRLSRGDLELTAFLERHGYHGPGEGVLESFMWRERPELVDALTASYETQNEGRSPEARHQERRAAHEAARAALLSELGPVRRRSALPLLKLAGKFSELRELGRAHVLRVLDVSRALARERGANLAADGLLEDAEDVHMLTIQELLDGDASRFAELAAQRRDDAAALEQIELPTRWRGSPEPRKIKSPEAERDLSRLTGVAASSGVVEGVVAVISDPGAEELPAEGILVCRGTDPSWVAQFMLASGVVIDVGSSMSHGAIVARELGLPAVVGTGDGTARLRTGDRVRVDGSSGVVDVLEPAALAAAPVD